MKLDNEIVDFKHIGLLFALEDSIERIIFLGYVDRAATYRFRRVAASSNNESAVYANNIRELIS